MLSSSPAIGSDGKVYIGSTYDDNNLYGFNSNGSLDWSYTTGGGIQSSPAVGSDGTVYIGSYDNCLYRINSNGTLGWSYDAAWYIFSSPAIGLDRKVHVGTYDNSHFYSIKPNGSLAWSYKTRRGTESSPAIGSDGKVYVGSYDNCLYSIVTTGSLDWSYETGGSIDSSPAIGSDGKVYIGSGYDDNNLYCIRQAPTPTPPIDLTPSKMTYDTSDFISVWADVWPLTTPCYPFVRIVMADGSTLYYEWGKGFMPSPVPYLGFNTGPIMIPYIIHDYPVLFEYFSLIARGTYYLEGGAVDATKTTSTDNLVYYGTVDRETLTVK